MQGHRKAAAWGPPDPSADMHFFYLTLMSLPSVADGQRPSHDTAVALQAADKATCLRSALGEALDAAVEVGLSPAFNLRLVAAAHGLQAFPVTCHITRALHSSPGCATIERSRWYGPYVVSIGVRACYAVKFFW